MLPFFPNDYSLPQQNASREVGKKAFLQGFSLGSLFLRSNSLDKYPASSSPCWRRRHRQSWTLSCHKFETLLRVKTHHKQSFCWDDMPNRDKIGQLQCKQSESSRGPSFVDFITSSILEGGCKPSRGNEGSNSWQRGHRGTTVGKLMSEPGNPPRTWKIMWPCGRGLYWTAETVTLFLFFTNKQDKHLFCSKQLQNFPLVILLKLLWKLINIRLPLIYAPTQPGNRIAIILPASKCCS